MGYIIKPLGKRVLVKIVKQKTISKAGILVPETVNRMSRNCQGEVVALGAGMGEAEQEEVQVGDMVMFDEWAGQEVKYPKPEESPNQDAIIQYQIVPFESVLLTYTDHEGLSIG